MNRNHLILFAAGAAVLAFPLEARAQAATVREILRVVKTIRAGSSSLTTAKINANLGPGDRLRTGGRSAAGIRFNADKSLLRVGELSEILISGGRGRDAQMVRGRVLADYKTPTTLRSGNAIAAVRGTKVEMWYDASNRKTRVNCYHGRVFVSSAKNGIRAGAADELTPTTLRDDELQEAGGKWVGGEIRFIDGAFNGEFRRVTAFDATTGTLTFEPALPAPKADGDNGYLLTEDSNAKIVQLTDGTGTEVKGDGDPSNPFRIPNQGFANLDRWQYWEALRDGLAFYVYPGTPEHDKTRDQYWPEQDAIERMTDRPDPVLDCGCGEVHHGFRHRLQHALASSVAERRIQQASAARQAVLGSQTASLVGAGPGTPSAEERAFPANVRRYDLEENRNHQFRFEPFAFASDDQDASGARVRYQASQGSVYIELGYRFLRLSGANNHDVSEGFLHIKGKQGNIIAGRQHLFLGPSNNTELGRLLALSTSDAIIYEPPTPRGFKQQVGYIFDSQALDSVDDFKGFYARGLLRAGGGNVGYSLPAETRDNRSLGWQIDFAQPVVRNVLDVYAEGGIDTRHRTVISGGFYVPWVYHKFKLDLFAEYQKREDLDERVTLRLRRELGNGLLLVAFLDRRLNHGGGFTGGGGILWSKKFR